MSGLRSSGPPRPKAPRGPRVALDALMEGPAADPVRRALWLDALEQRLRPHLPPSLVAHARLGNVNGAELVFLVDSPVWRARLRLAAPELLEAARRLGLAVSQVTVRTTTRPADTPPPAPRPPKPLSVATHDALQAALASLAIEPAAAARKPRGDAP